MSGSHFDVLAALVLSGEATESQKIEFEKMLKVSKENRAAFEKLKRVWSVNLSKGNKPYLEQREYLWHRYQAEGHSMKVKTQNFIFKIAASLFLTIVAGLVIYFLVGQDPYQNQQELYVVSEVVKETKAGEKLKTRLPDGTVVILNAGSRLSFSENFTDSTRMVQLTGEGFFDVAEDKNRPFTVRTQTMDVTALGTSFGVNAYPENTTDMVALVSGKLLIRNINNIEVRIDSGQAVTLSRADNEFLTSYIDYLTQVAWKDGVLHFNNNKFEEILLTLELNYGVEFMFDKRDLNLMRDTYTGTFKNESLENILKVLSFSMDFKFDINGKEVLIKN